MIRICCLCLGEVGEARSPLYDEVQELCARSFLPALPLVQPGNPALANEMWQLLKLFPLVISPA